jgi:hypothetical protein
MRSARRERHIGDRIFHLLAEVERYDLMANQILADPKKSSNWTALWSHCQKRAMEERAWTAAIAKTKPRPQAVLSMLPSDH